MAASSSWHRRDLLSIRGLGAASGGAIGAVFANEDDLAPPPDGRAPDRRRLANICVSRRAMGCEFSVYLPPQYPDAVAIASAGLAEIDRLDAHLTIYRDDSAVAELNRRAYDAPIHVDAELFGLLESAERLHRDTHAAFDVTAGALIRVWGFVGGPKRVPSEPQRLQALDRVGMQHVQLDPEKRVVRFRRRGLEINLGSIGKGFGIDRAIAMMRQEYGLDRALMQGGRSSLYGLGAPIGDERGWTVAIGDPVRPGEHIGVVCLRDRALATSNATNQHFVDGRGRRWGHVIDPRTGWPADTIAGASVLAPTSAEADALATAFFVAGLDGAERYCDEHPEVGAILVPNPDSAAGRGSHDRVITLGIADRHFERTSQPQCSNSRDE